MALKFLNKKGWHTGSLRNIENVWKAEQKHDAEQRKLEELRKQIQEERERDEFRELQQKAGLTPRQERLEFLYDSGLAVGKSSSDGYKALEAYPRADNSASASGSGSAPAPDSSKSSAPGALFEDKPQSANDAWRKLHSDPLLMIRQREQEALSRIKNNPVKMAMIRKSLEAKKNDGAVDGEHQKVKSKHKKHSSSKYHSDSENDGYEEKEKRKKAKHKKKEHQYSDEDSRGRTRHDRYSRIDNESERQRRNSPLKQKADRGEEDSKDRTRHHRHSLNDYESERQQHSTPPKRGDRGDSSPPKRRGRVDSSPPKQRERGDSSPPKRRERGDISPPKRRERGEDHERSKRSYEKSKHEDHLDHQTDKSIHKPKDNGISRQASESNYSAVPPRPDSLRRRGRAPQLSEEERAARLREMQMDAELHEEQRWKRLKKAEEDDAREASQAGASRGRSFLDAVHKSVYGAEKGGSSTIEESVRRRTHFLQGGREADEGNAFRR